MKSSFASSLVLVCFLSVGMFSGETLAVGASTGKTPSENAASRKWEEEYVKAARITVEKGVMGVMNGVHGPEQLQASVEQLYRHWDGWAESPLFLLEDDRDIDVYGNLYSLQVMCTTLRLAAEDWHKAENSDRSEEILERALWLEKESRLLAEPVAEIITHQSYSLYLPRRVEIMKEQFPYVEEFYRRHSFRNVLQQSGGAS